MTKLKKKHILWALLSLIFLAVFNTVFFVLGGTERDASVWIAYGFIHFAYFALLLTSLSARPGRGAASAVALYGVSGAYFAAEFVVGLVFICLKDRSWKISLSVQVILAGIYAFAAIVQLLGYEYHTAAARREAASPIRWSAAQVKALLGKPDKVEANAALQQLYKALLNCPADSFPETRPIEDEIARGVTELEQAVSQADTSRITAVAARLQAMAEDRGARLSAER